ncbi:MAG TPA: hypothetical protein VKA94_08875, partial [Hyphomicrobiales bacterium]|nr:hypothetical protein [Hyphomicrobiales bacterium]
HRKAHIRSAGPSRTRLGLVKMATGSPSHRRSMPSKKTIEYATVVLARISHGTNFLGCVRFLAQLVMEVH